MKTKFLKSKVFWLILFIVVVTLGYFIFRPSSTTGLYTTEAVKKGDIKQTVTATGMVQSAKEVSLNFKNPGWIKNIKVAVGDKVKAGQLLAQQQNSQLAAAVNNSRAAVLAAQANLTKIEAGTSVEDIKIAEENAARDQADLDTLIIKRDQELASLRDIALNTLDDASFDVDFSLSVVYKYLVDPYNTYGLVVNQSVLWNSISQQHSDVKQKKEAALISIQRAHSTKDASDIIFALDQTKIVLNSLASLLSDSFAVADSIVVNSTFTQTKKDTMRGDFATEQNTTNADLVAVQNSKSGLQNTAANYDNLIKTKQASLAYAQAQLAQKKSPPKQYDIDYYRAQYNQALANLAQAQANLSDTSLVAPLDGIITQKNNEVGEQSSAANPVLVMIAETKLEIEVNIPESDIVKIKVGQPVSVTLDAFGDTKIFSGQVSFIDPASTKISDVVYYKTKVFFTDNLGEAKAGMTANVDILAAEKSQILTTLQRAIKTKDKAYYVDVLQNNQPVEKKVELGLWGDEGLVEVLSGLNEGELVVTFTQKK